MDKTRRFLDRALTGGLDLGVLSPEDVVRHVTPLVLATHLPKSVMAGLISAGLKAKSFDAALIVKVVGTAALAAHVPTAILWKVIAEAAETVLSGQPAIAPRKKATPAAVEPAASSSESTVAASTSAATNRNGSNRDQGKSETSEKSDKKTKPGKADKPDKATKKDRASEPEPATPMAVESEVAAEPSAAETAPGFAAVEKKPNASSRPVTQPGPVGRAEARSYVGHDEITAATSALPGGGDFDVDTAVTAAPAAKGSAPPRAPTLDAEVEDALAGLEMEENDVILDDFEVAEDEVLDDSVEFDIARPDKN